MMKYKCVYVGVVLASFMQFLFCLKLNAQDNGKNRPKSPGAFFSIAYQDLTAKGINISDARTLEKSYQSTGDKSLLESNVISCLIYYKPSVGAGPIITDTSYYKLLTGCPRIARLRAADPLLIVTGYFCYHVMPGDTNLVTEYLMYFNWQSKNAPHSPLGNNAAPQNLSDEQGLNWLLVYTKDWVIQYPNEYKYMLGLFDSSFQKWKLNNPGGTHADFLRYYGKRVQHGYDQELEKLLVMSGSGVKKEQINVSLPPDEEMRKHPERFVENVYELLFMRKPNAEERSFLANFIAAHNDLTVREFYFAMMTSDEYNYY